MTQFVSHISVDVRNQTRNQRPGHMDIRDLIPRSYQNHSSPNRQPSPNRATGSHPPQSDHKYHPQEFPHPSHNHPHQYQHHHHHHHQHHQHHHENQSPAAYWTTAEEAQKRHKQQTDGNSSFLRAARAGNLEKVLEYLKGSIDINTSNINGLNALHLASKEGHAHVVTELLKKGANVNAATNKGNTSLHIASLGGQEEVVKILVQNGANVNVQSLNGFTPLYMAAQENHDSVVRYLLANGANQSLATEDGFTPLAVALQQGHDKVVAVLLENDTRGKVRLPALHIAAKKDDCKAAALLLQKDHSPDVTSKSGFTPLHIASHYGNENIAALLLEKNADVNFEAKHHITPLHVASKWGKANMVTLLLNKGAKIDASTRDGLTPLHCASRSGHEAVVELLLDRGAPISMKTKNGLAPLHMAAQGDHVECGRVLLHHKAPVDDVTVDYLTALHVSAHCGHVRIAKLLLDRKADPNARALNGFTPLHIACKKNRMKVVELLLKHGASIEATTESGLTPLHVASFMGCMSIVIYLIQHGANPDVPTVRGETPIHLAARASQADIIRILLRNGAQVDAKAREHQTALHIAARLGNVDIVGILLQHGASVDATTKELYTPLHIAAKEGQEEVAAVLLEHGASLTATTKRGFTPLHLAAKYGNIKVARLLLAKEAPVDAQGKNGVTALHVAAHYDHVNVALLLLEKGASPHAAAKNGYTPLHIAAKKNQMDIATSLLEYGAKANAESKAGFTPLHLACQEGHTDMATLIIGHDGNVNAKAKNGLTPLHLCAQEDRVNCATILVNNKCDIDPKTKAGYTPLHVACHFGQLNMNRFLLQHGASVEATNAQGYTPLHQAAQQGHTLIINLLLEHKASPNATTNQGQTALSIAQRLGYISVVETLKVVTETVVTTSSTTVTEEKYKVMAPETMQETFMSDSEEEGAEETMLGDHSYSYLTAEEIKFDDSIPIDVTKDERPAPEGLITRDSAPLIEQESVSPAHHMMTDSFVSNLAPDNVEISKSPATTGRLKWKTFLVSFMVDARGGAMRGCRHSGVRVIIPPRKASMPMRITCRYLRKEKLIHPPPLMEGEACASRILEVGPVGGKFLGPVIIEVPHFAALRGREREIIIMRSDNGETWREHTFDASEEAVQEILSESFENEADINALDAEFSSNRIARILTTDFPQYFAVISRIRQEVHSIGPEGGMVSSTVVPQVQAIFPDGALTKKIKVGLQAQPIPTDLVTKMLGNRVAVSPIVTVEPRRRKFHKPITLTIPVPQAATRGMINQYSGDTPTLRLLCSITGSTKSGGATKAQWEDVTGSTPLTFVNDCVSFTTTVSARFWLMDCRQVNEATKFATELYREAIYVPFMAKFVVFAKRHDLLEAQLRVFCMTDDKEDKTLESQENFTEVAKSKDVEVLEYKPQFLEFAGNLIPVTVSGEQLHLNFVAFRENRLPFTMKVRDAHQDPIGRIAFMRESRKTRGEPMQAPICNLNIQLPHEVVEERSPGRDYVTIENKHTFMKETGLVGSDKVYKADLNFIDVARELSGDWVVLAQELDVRNDDINSIKSQSRNEKEQALKMLKFWQASTPPEKATGNTLEKALRTIKRDDIVAKCMKNVHHTRDSLERAIDQISADQKGFDILKEELGHSRDGSTCASIGREVSLDVSHDEMDIMKDAESMEESEGEGNLPARDRPEGRPNTHPKAVKENGTRKEAYEDSERAVAAQKFLEFLEEQDREESEERAYYRGETEPNKELYVVTEEVPVPNGQKTNNDSLSAMPGSKTDTQTKTTEVLEISNSGEITHTITQITKTTGLEEHAPTGESQNQIRQSNQQPQPSPVEPQKMYENETWQSGEQDTSQVSVSSLPEDEKSEQTTTTMSSTTTTTAAGDNLLASPVFTKVSEDSSNVQLVVEQKEIKTRKKGLQKETKKATKEVTHSPGATKAVDNNEKPNKIISGQTKGEIPERDLYHDFAQDFVDNITSTALKNLCSTLSESEWTEESEDGGIRHVIEQTATCTTRDSGDEKLPLGSNVPPKKPQRARKLTDTIEKDVNQRKTHLKQTETKAIKQTDVSHTSSTNEQRVRPAPLGKDERKAPAGTPAKPMRKIAVDSKRTATSKGKANLNTHSKHRSASTPHQLKEHKPTLVSLHDFLDDIRFIDSLHSSFEVNSEDERAAHFHKGSSEMSLSAHPFMHESLMLSDYDLNTLRQEIPPENFDIIEKAFRIAMMHNSRHEDSTIWKTINANQTIPVIMPQEVNLSEKNLPSLISLSKTDPHTDQMHDFNNNALPAASEHFRLVKVRHINTQTSVATVDVAVQTVKSFLRSLRKDEEDGGRNCVKCGAAFALKFFDNHEMDVESETSKGTQISFDESDFCTTCCTSECDECDSEESVDENLNEAIIAGQLAVETGLLALITNELRLINGEIALSMGNTLLFPSEVLPEIKCTSLETRTGQESFHGLPPLSLPLTSREYVKVEEDRAADAQINQNRNSKGSSSPPKTTKRVKKREKLPEKQLSSDVCLSGSERFDVSSDEILSSDLELKSKKADIQMSQKTLFYLESESSVERLNVEEYSDKDRNSSAEKSDNSIKEGEFLKDSFDLLSSQVVDDITKMGTVFTSSEIVSSLNAENDRSDFINKFADDELPNFKPEELLKMISFNKPTETDRCRNNDDDVSLWALKSLSLEESQTSDLQTAEISTTETTETVKFFSKASNENNEIDIDFNSFGNSLGPVQQNLPSNSMQEDVFTAIQNPLSQVDDVKATSSVPFELMQYLSPMALSGPRQDSDEYSEEYSEEDFEGDFEEDSSGLDQNLTEFEREAGVLKVNTNMDQTNTSDVSEDDNTNILDTSESALAKSSSPEPEKTLHPTDTAKVLSDDTFFTASELQSKRADASLSDDTNILLLASVPSSGHLKPEEYGELDRNSGAEKSDFVEDLLLSSRVDSDVTSIGIASKELTNTSESVNAVNTLNSSGVDRSDVSDKHDNSSSLKSEKLLKTAFVEPVDNKTDDDLSLMSLIEKYSSQSPNFETADDSTETSETAETVIYHPQGSNEELETDVDIDSIADSVGSVQESSFSSSVPEDSYKAFAMDKGLSQVDDMNKMGIVPFELLQYLSPVALSGPRQDSEEENSDKGLAKFEKAEEVSKEKATPTLTKLSEAPEDDSTNRIESSKPKVPKDSLLEKPVPQTDAKVPSNEVLYTDSELLSKDANIQISQSSPLTEDQNHLFLTSDPSLDRSSNESIEAVKFLQDSPEALSSQTDSDITNDVTNEMFKESPREREKSSDTINALNALSGSSIDSSDVVDKHADDVTLVTDANDSLLSVLDITGVEIVSKQLEQSGELVSAIDALSGSNIHRSGVTDEYSNDDQLNLKSEKSLKTDAFIEPPETCIRENNDDVSQMSPFKNSSLDPQSSDSIVFETAENFSKTSEDIRKKECYTEGLNEGQVTNDSIEDSVGPVQESSFSDSTRKATSNAFTVQKDLSQIDDVNEMSSVPFELLQYLSPLALSGPRQDSEEESSDQSVAQLEKEEKGSKEKEKLALTKLSVASKDDSTNNIETSKPEVPKDSSVEEPVVQTDVPSHGLMFKDSESISKKADFQISQTTPLSDDPNLLPLVSDSSLEYLKAEEFSELDAQLNAEEFETFLEPYESIGIVDSYGSLSSVADSDTTFETASMELTPSRETSDEFVSIGNSLRSSGIDRSDVGDNSSNAKSEEFLEADGFDEDTYVSRNDDKFCLMPLDESCSSESLTFKTAEDFTETYSSTETLEYYTQSSNEGSETDVGDECSSLNDIIQEDGLSVFTVQKDLAQVDDGNEIGDVPAELLQYISPVAISGPLQDSEEESSDHSLTESKKRKEVSKEKAKPAKLADAPEDDRTNDRETSKSDAEKDFGAVPQTDAKAFADEEVPQVNQSSKQGLAKFEIATEVDKEDALVTLSNALQHGSINNLEIREPEVENDFCVEEAVPQTATKLPSDDMLFTDTVSILEKTDSVMLQETFLHDDPNLSTSDPSLEYFKAEEYGEPNVNLDAEKCENFFEAVESVEDSSDLLSSIANSSITDGGKTSTDSTPKLERIGLANSSNDLNSSEIDRSDESADFKPEELLKTDALDEPSDTHLNKNKDSLSLISLKESLSSESFQTAEEFIEASETAKTVKYDVEDSNDGHETDLDIDMRDDSIASVQESSFIESIQEDSLKAFTVQKGFAQVDDGNAISDVPQKLLQDVSQDVHEVISVPYELEYVSPVALSSLRQDSEEENSDKSLTKFEKGVEVSKEKEQQTLTKPSESPEGDSTNKKGTGKPKVSKDSSVEEPVVQTDVLSDGLMFKDSELISKKADFQILQMTPLSDDPNLLPLVSDSSLEYLKAEEFSEPDAHLNVEECETFLEPNESIVQSYGSLSSVVDSDVTNFETASIELTPSDEFLNIENSPRSSDIDRLDVGNNSSNVETEEKVAQTLTKLSEAIEDDSINKIETRILKTQNDSSVEKSVPQPDAKVSLDDALLTDSELTSKEANIGMSETTLLYEDPNLLPLALDPSLESQNDEEYGEPDGNLDAEECETFFEAVESVEDSFDSLSSDSDFTEAENASKLLAHRSGLISAFSDSGIDRSDISDKYDDPSNLKPKKLLKTAVEEPTETYVSKNNDDQSQMSPLRSFSLEEPQTSDSIVIETAENLPETIQKVESCIEGSNEFQVTDDSIADSVELVHESPFSNSNQEDSLTVFPMDKGLSQADEVNEMASVSYELEYVSPVALSSSRQNSEEESSNQSLTKLEKGEEFSKEKATTLTKLSEAPKDDSTNNIETSKPEDFSVEEPVVQTDTNVHSDDILFTDSELISKKADIQVSQLSPLTDDQNLLPLVSDSSLDTSLNESIEAVEFLKVSPEVLSSQTDSDTTNEMIKELTPDRKKSSDTINALNAPSSSGIDRSDDVDKHADDVTLVTDANDSLLSDSDITGVETVSKQLGQSGELVSAIDALSGSNIDRSDVTDEYSDDNQLNLKSEKSLKTDAFIEPPETCIRENNDDVSQMPLEQSQPSDSLTLETTENFIEISENAKTAYVYPQTSDKKLEIDANINDNADSVKPVEEGLLSNSVEEYNLTDRSINLPDTFVPMEKDLSQPCNVVEVITVPAEISAYVSPTPLSDPSQDIEEGSFAKFEEATDVSRTSLKSLCTASQVDSTTNLETNLLDEITKDSSTEMQAVRQTNTNTTTKTVIERKSSSIPKDSPSEVKSTQVSTVVSTKESKTLSTNSSLEVEIGSKTSSSEAEEVSPEVEKHKTEQLLLASAESAKLQREAQPEQKQVKKRLIPHIESIYIKQELTEEEITLPAPPGKESKEKEGSLSKIPTSTFHARPPAPKQTTTATTATTVTTNKSASSAASSATSVTTKRSMTAKEPSSTKDEKVERTTTKNTITTTTTTTTSSANVTNENHSSSPIHQARTIPPKATSGSASDHELEDGERDDSDKSPLNKPSPPEFVDAETAERELSPVVEYPSYLAPDAHIKVGVSPTEEKQGDSGLTGSESAVSFGEADVFNSDNEAPQLREKSLLQEVSKENEKKVEQVEVEDKQGTEKERASEDVLAFDNSAFEGAEAIDARDASKDGVRSPFEVSRENIYQASLDAMKQDSQEESTEGSLMKEIKAHIFKQSLDDGNEELSQREPLKSGDRVVQKVKTEIVKDVLDQSIEECTPEKKEIKAELSSERTTISSSTILESITSTAKTEVVSRTEVKESCVAWEQPMSEHLSYEERQPSSGKGDKLDDESTASDVESHKTDDYAIVDDPKQIEEEAAMLARDIVGKVKDEILKRPIFHEVSSEISDEDLVEVDEEDIVNVQGKLLVDLMATKSSDADASADDVKFVSTVVKKDSITIEPPTVIKMGSPVSDKEKDCSSASDVHLRSSSDTSKSPGQSRPVSNEFNLDIVPGGVPAQGHSASEYETCATSQEGSATYITATAVASQDTSYATARSSSLSCESRESSRESTISVDSESSGHLGEASSEASETVVIGDIRDVQTPIIHEEENEDEDSPEEDESSKTPIVGTIKEPYDTEIPESVLRGGMEVSFMGQSSWEVIERTISEESSSSPFEIISSQELDSEAHAERSNRQIEPQQQQQQQSLQQQQLLSSTEALDADQPSLSENSVASWRSSSIGTAVHVSGHGNNSLTEAGNGAAGSTHGQGDIRSSFSESTCSLENSAVLDNNSLPPTSTEQMNGLQMHFTQVNGPVEVDYNPDYDTSDHSGNVSVNRFQMQSTQIISHTSSSELPTDTPLVSQSSIASSVLSEQTRHQLSYDLSPEIPVTSTAPETLSSRSADTQQEDRPPSPVPPVDFGNRATGAQSSLGAIPGLSKSSTAEQLQQSPCSDDTDACLIYTGPEEKKETKDEGSPAKDEQGELVDLGEGQSSGSAVGLDFVRSKPVPVNLNRLSGVSIGTASGCSSTGSSLQEFERLEAELLAKTGKKSVHGSSDSLGSLGSGKLLVARSLEKDNVSVDSLTDFEKLEAECREAERIERAAREEAARLSEIEEGHESQASDSQETLSDPGHPDSDSDDYEKRMSEIDDIIKLAQSNVEKMHKVSSIDNSKVVPEGEDEEKKKEEEEDKDKFEEQGPASKRGI